MIKNKEKNFISAVVYVRNSESQLMNFLTRLSSALDENFDHYEIICVNDSSADQSKKRIEEFAESTGNTVISIINMSFFQGMELSMQAGVDLAIGDYIYEFDFLDQDCDFSLLMDTYYKAMDGYDIVSVSPKPAIGFFSKTFYKVFNRYCIGKHSIQQETFRILSRRAINRVNSLAISLVYRKAMYANCGLRTERIFYHSTMKKISDKEVQTNRSQLAIDSLMLFTNALQRFSLCISLLFLGATVIIGGYSWVAYWGPHQPVAGWTPIMLYLSIGFFGIFLILTIVLKYLSTIIQLIFRKRQYLVESIDKLTNN